MKENSLAHQLKRGSARLKPKPNNERDTAAKVVRLDLDAKTLSEMIAGRGTILPNLPNAQDNLVVAKLSTSKIGDLPIDQFGRLLCKNESHRAKKTSSPFASL